MISVRGLVSIALGLAACGGSSSKSPDGGAVPDAGAPGGPDAGPGPGSDAGAPDAAPPPVLGTRFDGVAETWPVGAAGQVEGFYDPDLFSSYRYWTTLDLDGDGRFDLVQTGDSAVAQSVWDAAGSPYWKLLRGSGAGWAGDAVSFAVAASGQSAGFFATDVTNGGLEWRTLDLDGDRRPDLIHTTDPLTGVVWDANGSPHWKVYLNQGDEFATTATLWAVPDAGIPAGFYKLDQEAGNARWATIDLDGDRRPELVQTTDPVTARVWDAAGSPHWKVFAQSGNGFAGDATLWSVPDSGTFSGFHVVAAAGGTEQWRTLDLDGDGRRDLVQSTDPATGWVWDAAGSPYWKIYRGQAGGFAASAQWSVPPNGLADGFLTVQSADSYRRWAVLDLDGDGLLDLVQTGDTAHATRVWDAAGAPYWKLFRNTGSGFSADLHRWDAPQSGGAAGFYAARADVGVDHWATFDADADGLADVVHTADPATARVWDAAGSPYWKVYRGQP